MALRLLKRASVVRSAVATPRITGSVRSQRFYADEANTPQATSNVSGNPRSGSPEEKLTNSGVRGARTQQQDTQPVSGLEGAQQGGGLGGQEEPNQPNQGDIRPDPNKPAHEKREEVLKEGEKPLDPADK